MNPLANVEYDARLEKRRKLINAGGPRASRPNCYATSGYTGVPLVAVRHRCTSFSAALDPEGNIVAIKRLAL